MDLADPADVERFIGEACEILGDEPLNALVNNAAVSPKSDFQERLGCLNGSLDDWREVFQLNFFTPLALARGFSIALARAARAEEADANGAGGNGATPRKMASGQRRGARRRPSSTSPRSPATLSTRSPARPIPRRRRRCRR